MRASIPSTTLIVFCLFAAGCAGHNCCTTCVSKPTPVMACQPVERGLAPFDISLVPPQELAPRLFAEQKFCALPERTAQCLAAKNSSKGNILSHEADAAAAQSGGLGHHHDGSELTSEVLRLNAVQKRNEAAGDALEVMLRLVEAEQGSDNLERRGETTNLMLADMDRLQARGILPPVPKADIASQRLELWRRQADLQATIQTLNFHLKDLLGVELAGDNRFWPEVSFVVNTDLPNREAALNFALANRADLAAAHKVACADNAERAQAVRTLLAIAGGGVGGAPPGGCILLALHHGGSDEEDSARAAQAAELQADRQRAVTHETLLAVAVLEARLTQIAISRQKLDVANAHLQATLDQQKLAGVSPLTSRKARIDQLAAEQDLFHDVIEWKLAVVKLKEAQGLLAIECGFDGVCPGNASFAAGAKPAVNANTIAAPIPVPGPDSIGRR